MKLKLKRHVKDRQRTLLLREDSGRTGDTPQGRNDHLEYGGRITFCLNMVRNAPMRQYLNPF